MKNMTRVAFICVLCFFQAACGTFFGRLNELKDIEPRYYKGTRGGLYLLGYVEEQRKDHMAGTIACYYMFFVCPLSTLASLPLDFAIDTVLLPVDFYQDQQRKNAPPAAADE